MFIYLLAVSGVMINMHYCGNELESWGVYASNDGCATDSCSDDMEEEEGCCKDEVIAAKVTVDQNVVDSLKFKLSFVDWIIPLQPFYVAETQAIHVVSQSVHCMPNAPPGLWQEIPLFKLHSSFTYYG